MLFRSDKHNQNECEYLLNVCKLAYLAYFLESPYVGVRGYHYGICYPGARWLVGGVGWECSAVVAAPPPEIENAKWIWDARPINQDSGRLSRGPPVARVQYRYFARAPCIGKTSLKTYKIE